jgi:hypothetical protein
MIIIAQIHAYGIVCRALGGQNCLHGLYKQTPTQLYAESDIHTVVPIETYARHFNARMLCAIYATT